MGKNIVAHRFGTRGEWRQWLQDNHDKEPEAWLVFPLRSSGEDGIPYNDAVEEALCFCWIDSTVRALDEGHRMQRFSPRNPKSGYSQANKERLRWLADRGLVHPAVMERVSPMLEEPYVFPDDIIDAIREDDVAWAHYQGFSEPYKRIRVAYIDAARKRPEEFERRLGNFIERTREGKIITGYGGIDKYY